jgi:hypothetical protein
MSREPQRNLTPSGRTAFRVLLACAMGVALVAASWVVGLSDRTGSTPAAGPTTVTVVVRDGSVLGGARTLDVERGRHVTLEVTADVVDEVHVHGYGIVLGIRPRRSIDVTFEATIPGVFEVELEALRLSLVRVRVS